MQSAIPSRHRRRPASPIRCSTASASFRAVLDAMARPGRLARIDHGAGAAGAARSGDRRRRADAGRLRRAGLARSRCRLRGGRRLFRASTAGAPIVADPARAAFAVSASRRPSLARFAPAPTNSPRAATTVIVQVADARRRRDAHPDRPGHREPASHGRNRPAAMISGPSGAPSMRDFPRGVDLILACRPASAAACRAATRPWRPRHVCRGQGRRARHRQRPSPARRGAARRSAPCPS